MCASPRPSSPMQRVGGHAVADVRHLDGLDALVAELADVAADGDAADRGPGSFSTMKQVMPSSVRAASATSPARSPLVTHIFVPLTTYSSPSRVARHDDVAGVAAGVGLREREARRAARRWPAAAASAASAPRCRGARSGARAIVCVLTMPDSDIQPYAELLVGALRGGSRPCASTRRWSPRSSPDCVGHAGGERAPPPARASCARRAAGPFRGARSSRSAFAAFRSHTGAACAAADARRRSPSPRS